MSGFRFVECAQCRPDQIHVLTQVRCGGSGYLANGTITSHLLLDAGGHYGQRAIDFRIVEIFCFQCRTDAVTGRFQCRRRSSGGLALEGDFSFLRRDDESGRRRIRHGAIERIGGGRDANQDKHDQPHALLAVIAAVGEGYTGAGQNQQTTNPPGRRRGILRFLIEFGAAHDELHQPQQETRGDETKDGAEQESLAYLGRLVPVNA